MRGYEVRQSTTVKVRDTAKAGDFLAGVGEKGANEVSSLNFTFDDPDQVQDEARNEAIADAKAKADVLAKQLGVRIVRAGDVETLRRALEEAGGGVLVLAGADDDLVGETLRRVLGR